MSYTKGPWRVEERGSDIECEPGIYGPDGQSIGKLWDWEQFQEENTANARLIGAAPELLEALEAMVAEWVDYTTINNLGDPYAKHNMKLAIATIRKAKEPQQ